MIEIIPAIDIIDGKCVRLTRGNYDTKRVYGDAVAMAEEYESMGFRRIHIVDLDGAKNKKVTNLPTLEAICSKTRLEVDFGGGVRTLEDLQRIFDTGAQMASVGSIAVTHPELYGQWMNAFGAEKLILCADTRDGMVSINGWKDDSGTRLADFLAYYLNNGTRNVLITDISRDGTLTGPSVTLYAELMRLYPECHLIASGGVSAIADIDALENANVPAVVVGKAIYEGTIDLNRLKERCLKKE